MDLCKYRHIFGKEGEGAHSYRIMNIAIVDLAATIIAAFLIAKVIKQPFWLVLLILLIMGVIMHRMFCVNTTVNKYLFGYV